MRTFIENYLHFMKNCIRPHYEKLKPLKSGFIENTNFENNNRDPCFILMIKQHNTLSLWNGYQINPKITQNILYSHGFKSQIKLVFSFLTLEQHTTFSFCQSHRWSILNQSFASVASKNRFT